MKTAILLHSSHHGNTRKLVDAIKEADPSVTVIDINETDAADLSGYDTIGIASGIYGANFSKKIQNYVAANLPEGKNVFFLYTSSLNLKGFTKSIRKITDAKGAKVLGQYGCTGYDTVGPFRIVGGVGKGHPDEKEIAYAVKFYQGLSK